MTPPILVRGDARSLPLPSDSVDLVVTSPPYFGLRDYGYDGQIGSEPTPQQFVASLLDCTREMVRVLKPSGSIWVNLGDKYGRDGGLGRSRNLPGAGAGSEGQRPAHRRAPWNRDKSLLMIPERYRIACADQLDLVVRAVVVWSKPNGMPESVTDRVRRSHEDWVHLTLAPDYYADMDPVRDPSSGYERRRTARATPGGQRPRAMADTCNPAGRLPGSVWSIPTQPLQVPEEVGADHYAAFPMEWPRRIVQAWSPPGGVVLDPFGGTGTTALVASMLGRVGVSHDASADYGRIARWRCSDPKERARASGAAADVVSAIQPKVAGQFSMLDLLAGEGVAS